MNLVSVPDELGDSCYIKLLIPNEAEDFGSNDGVGTTQRLYPNGYYLKDNIYYRNGGHLTWNAISGKEKTDCRLICWLSRRKVRTGALTRQRFTAITI